MPGRTRTFGEAPQLDRRDQPAPLGRLIFLDSDGHPAAITGAWIWERAPGDTQEVWVGGAQLVIGYSRDATRAEEEAWAVREVAEATDSWWISNGAVRYSILQRAREGGWRARRNNVQWRAQPDGGWSAIHNERGWYAVYPLPPHQVDAMSWERACSLAGVVPHPGPHDGRWEQDCACCEAASNRPCSCHTSVADHMEALSRATALQHGH